MKKRNKSRITVILLVLLLTISSTARAGGPLGGDRFLIYNNGAINSEEEATGAYNSQRQEYLVVWEGGGIWGQRVAASGTLLGSTFQISSNGYSPDVTYNSTANEYLVVWQTDADVRGRILSEAGVPLYSVINIATGYIAPIPSNSYYYDQPAVAYASTSERYLVVCRYHWASDGGSMIWARSYLSNGTSDVSFSVAAYSTTETPEQPDLAYNRSRNEFLVVWQKVAGSDVDVYGRRAAMTGGAGVLGSEFYIANSFDDEIGPAVAAIATVPNQGQYLVAWESDQGLDSNVEARTVSGDGMLGAWRSLADTPWGEHGPAVAGCESDRQFLVTWMWVPVITPPAMMQVQARTLALDGAPLHDTTLVGGGQVFESFVIAGPYGDFLVAFDDNETFATYSRGIYGRLWGNRIYLPLVLRAE